MKKKVIVLGAGRVGKAMALDLATAFEVTSADINTARLSEIAASGIQTLEIDLSDSNSLTKALQPFDLVVGALPGFMGFPTTRTVIEAGKNMVDISFFAEDPFLLDNAAKQKGVTILTDCGVAPGMSNVLLGHHNESMEIEKYECLVGGLPVVREWPYEYKAVFSPVDVIEEYVRPARIIQNKTIVTREALSDPELVQFNGIGTLESWNSDGLRTLLTTMPHIPNMIEKTLRYPGCIEYLRVLRETGFFSKEPIIVNGSPVRPIDVTAQLLFPKWKLMPGEEEFTVMRIRIEGQENGRFKCYQYDLFDRTDLKKGTLSMARTTGYVCTAIAHLVMNGAYARRGISPPEFIGQDATHVSFIQNYLAQRGVKYNLTTSN
ncbi:MAG TPA: saccharopine dehydrogenase C-terminal domain-containing protein [Cyclobacteriaceae bacterium]|nr:saccharopine dehydrogenase C-terminal domain-containing protein [Cyclobacteriaceae bacterium]